jgi:hypothetical protein
LEEIVENRSDLFSTIRFDASAASVQTVPLTDGMSYVLETLPLYAAACIGNLENPG